MMFLRLGKLPFFIAGSFAASLLTFGAMPAQAADLDSTTATAVAPLLFFSPNPLNGAVGDSFTVTNNSGQTIGPVVGGSTGSVSVGSLLCNGSQATCLVSNAGSTTYTITTLGIITFEGGGNTGPLLLDGVGVAGTDLALVFPTASINANGGTCSGPTQYIRYQGQNAANGTFTAPTAASCTRTNYSLAGWARSATATVSEFAPGSTVSIGNQSFTLFAVWRPNGIEIAYDANVGLGTQCLSSNGTNVTTAAERKTTPTVVPALSAAAGQAPCTPRGHTLSGWSSTGDGPQILVKGEAFPASFTGTSQTMYAKWEPDRFGLSAQVGSLTVGGSPLTICAGVEEVVTLTATKNGVAAAGQVIYVSFLSEDLKLTTDKSGQVQVVIKKSQRRPMMTFYADFGNQYVSLVFFERDAKECGVKKTITLTSNDTLIRCRGDMDVVTTGYVDGSYVSLLVKKAGEKEFTFWTGGFLRQGKISFFVGDQLPPGLTTFVASRYDPTRGLWVNSNTEQIPVFDCKQR